MYRYQVYGLTIESEVALSHRLLAAASDAQPDVRFTLSAELPPSVDSAWSSTEEGTGALLAGVCRLSRSGEVFRIRFADQADFYLGPDWIHCRMDSDWDPALAELRLLGPVLSFWLERQGVLTLHASAVAWQGRAVAFLGSRRQGKTSLAAASLAAGFSLLTDDVLPIEVEIAQLFARPSYPQMRLWPDLAHWLYGQLGLSDSWVQLPPVHRAASKRRFAVDELPGAFAGTALPLVRVYVLGGGPQTVPFSELSSREALVDLLRHSFSVRLVEAAGWAADRLDRLATLASRVSFRRLPVSRDLSRLPETVEWVRQDMVAENGRGT